MTAQPVASAHTRIYAILGDPIDHSLSPVIMNSMFRRLGMDRVFLALRANRESISRVFPVLRGLDFAGYVLTMPVKEDVAPFLDEVRDEAELSGAVNCIMNRDGKLVGYNTDSVGFWTATTATLEKRDAGAGENPPQSLFIMGSGGFSKAAVTQAVMRGVRTVWVASPADAHRETFGRFADTLRERYSGLSVTMLDWVPSLWRDAVSQADIIANATPNGLNGAGDLERIFPYEQANGNAVFFDAIYKPLTTAFLAEARKRGHAGVDGLDLLSHQGVCSFKIWTGRDADAATMRADALAFLGEKA